MLHYAYMDYDHASVVMGQIMELYSEVQKLSNSFTKKLVAISDDDWQQLLEDNELKEVSFVLNEIRDDGKRLLSVEEERLISELDNDGLSAWSCLFVNTDSLMTILL